MITSLGGVKVNLASHTVCEVVVCGQISSWCTSKLEGKDYICRNLQCTVKHSPKHEKQFCDRHYRDLHR